MFGDTFQQAFASVLQQLKITGYLCGGTVRDLLLSRSFHDVDVVLSGKIFEAARLFAGHLKSPYFILDEERQVARVICDGGYWDISGFRDTTIEGDLLKRDFTINALAVEFNEYLQNRNLQTLIDPSGGAEDLRNGVIRAVTGQALSEDPLRMLRAYRLHAELKFKIDPAVAEHIASFHQQISGVATERIAEELDRIFLQPDSASTWEPLSCTPLFDSMLPELFPLKGCEQGGYHHLDVWQHSLAALKNFEHLIASLEEIFPQYASQIRTYLASVAAVLDRGRILKWAVLLHDIGKPQTRELREPGRWKFHGHDHVGSDIAETLLMRLKFARKDSQLISHFIEHHLRPLNMFNSETRNPDQKFKFFRATGTEGIGVLLISYGDVAASRGPLADPNRDAEFLEMLREMVAYYFDQYLPAVNTPVLIKGRDLMAFLMMEPGPLMGELLQEIRENQLVGAIRTRDEGLEFARNWVKNRK